MLLAIVERAERPRGPEQALNILFRDSNTNAVDIEEEKEKRNKFLRSLELFLGPRFVGRWGRLGAPDAGNKVRALTGRAGKQCLVELGAGAGVVWHCGSQLFAVAGRLVSQQVAQFFEQHLQVPTRPAASHLHPAAGIPRSA